MGLDRASERYENKVVRSGAPGVVDQAGPRWGCARLTTPLKTQVYTDFPLVARLFGYLFSVDVQTDLVGAAVSRIHDIVLGCDDTKCSNTRNLWYDRRMVHICNMLVTNHWHSC